MNVSRAMGVALTDAQIRNLLDKKDTGQRLKGKGYADMVAGRTKPAKKAFADIRMEYIAFELLAPDNAAGQLDRLEEHIYSR